MPSNAFSNITMLKSKLKNVERDGENQREYVSTAVIMNPKSEMIFELISSSDAAEKELSSKSKMVFL